MPPKKQKKVQEPALKEEGEKGELNQERDDGTSKFACDCGKQYGSLAAVHTHINNKHNATPEMKKEYKRKIVNPKKVGQPSTSSIRMKDILYPQDEAELMCLADITLKKIYDKVFETLGASESKILIDINQQVDFSDSDIEECLADLVEDSELKAEAQKKERTLSNRQKQINEKVKKEVSNRKLDEINRFLENEEGKELIRFKIKKFTLDVIHQLSKFFKIDFAAKIELSLQLIHSSIKAQKKKETELSGFFQKELKQIWDHYSCPDIAGILVEYYKEWNKIHFSFNEWKKTKGENAI